MTNERPEPTERMARLVMRLDEARTETHCPACGNDGWDYAATTAILPKTAPNPERSGLDVLPLVCPNCGFVRLHSTQHLENRPERH